jgi:hypothetical protein
MTLGSANTFPLPSPITRLPSPADDDTSGKSRLWDALWFWPIGIALAVMTWWPLGVRSASGLQGGDTYTYFFPLKAWYADRLQAGELPLWNPRVGHGFPALGESQTGVFYPFHLLLYRYLPLNAAYHVTFLLHYALAFGFTCHYVRCFRFGLIECLLASVIFVYGWFPARSCLEWAILTGAWIPLAFWGVERHVAESRPRSLLATQLAIVMQLLAGHFNMAFITLVGVTVYAAVRLLLERQPWNSVLRFVLPLATVFGLAAGVAAIQLVPSWELKTRSQRGEAAFGKQQVGYGAIPWSYLPQVVQPWKFYAQLNDPQFERQQFGERNTNKVEAHLYFGLIPMVLAAIALLVAVIRSISGKGDGANRVVWVWLILGAIGLTFAVGLWTPLAVHLPGFGYFTGPGRYGVLVQLAIAVLAGAGAHGVRQWTVVRARGHVRITWFASLVGCVVLALLTEVWTSWAGGGAAFLNAFLPVRAGWLTEPQLRWALLLACIVCANITLMLRRPDSLQAVTAAAVAWVDLMLVAQFVQFAEIRRESPIHLRDISAVRMLLTPWSPPARLLARDQNAVSLCGVATVPVYLGIGPREYFSGPLRIPPDFHWESTVSSKMLHWLRWAGVTHVLAFDPISDEELLLYWRGFDPFLHGLLGRPLEQPLWLYAVNGTRGRCYWVPAGDERAALDEQFPGPVQSNPVAKVVERSNEVAITVACDEAAVVVLTDLMYPGWEVLVDGVVADAVADTVFRAVRVDAGTHDIRWRYRPGSLRVGLILSLLSVVGTGLFIVRRSRR